MVGINIDKETRNRLDKFRSKLGRELETWVSCDQAIVILLERHGKEKSK